MYISLLEREDTNGIKYETLGFKLCYQKPGFTITGKAKLTTKLVTDTEPKGSHILKFGKINLYKCLMLC